MRTLDLIPAEFNKGNISFDASAIGLTPSAASHTEDLNLESASFAMHMNNQGAESNLALDDKKSKASTNPADFAPTEANPSNEQLDKEVLDEEERLENPQIDDLLVLAHLNLQPSIKLEPMAREFNGGELSLAAFAELTTDNRQLDGTSEGVIELATNIMDLELNLDLDLEPQGLNHEFAMQEAAPTPPNTPAINELAPDLLDLEVDQEELLNLNVAAKNLQAHEDLTTLKFTQEQQNIEANLNANLPEQITLQQTASENHLPPKAVKSLELSALNQVESEDEEFTFDVLDALDFGAIKQDKKLIPLDERVEGDTITDSQFTLSSNQDELSQVNQTLNPKLYSELNLNSLNTPQPLDQVNVPLIPAQEFNVYAQVGSSEWGNEIAEIIGKHMYQANLKYASLKLNPSELGPINLEFVFDNASNQATINFEVAQKGTQKLLEQTADSVIKQLTSDAGFLNVNLQFSSFERHENFRNPHELSKTKYAPESVEVANIEPTPIKTHLHGGLIDIKV